MADHVAYRWAKRIVVTVVGFTVLAAGIVMIVLPGPALVVIPVGNSWSRHHLSKTRYS